MVGEFTTEYSNLCLETIFNMRVNARKEDGGETLKTLFKIFCVDYFNTYSQLSLMQLLRNAEYTTYIRNWLDKMLPEPTGRAAGILKANNRVSNRALVLTAFDAAVDMSKFLGGEIAKYPVTEMYVGFPKWLPEQSHQDSWKPGRPPYLLFLDLLRLWRVALSIVFESMLTVPALKDNIKFYYLFHPQILFSKFCIARPTLLSYPTKTLGTFTQKPTKEYKEMQSSLSNYIKIHLSTAKNKEVVFYFDMVLKRSPGSYTKDEEIYEDQPNLIRKALKTTLEPNNEPLVWMGDEEQNAGLKQYMSECIRIMDKLRAEEGLPPKEPGLFHEYLAAGAPRIPIDAYSPYVTQIGTPLSFNKCYFIQKEPNVNNTIVDVYLERSRLAFNKKPGLELTAKEKKQVVTDGVMMKTLYHNMGLAWKAWKESPSLKTMQDFVFADLSAFNKEPLPSNWEHRFRNTWFGKRMALILDMVFGEFIQEYYNTKYFSSLDLKPFHKLGLQFRFSGFKDVVRMCFDHNIALPDLIASNTQFGTINRVPLSKITEILCEIEKIPVDPTKPQVVPWETIPTSIPPEAKARVEAFLRTLGLKS